MEWRYRHIQMGAPHHRRHARDRRLGGGHLPRHEPCCGRRSLTSGPCGPSCERRREPVRRRLPERSRLVPVGEFALSSEAFTHGGEIPRRHTSRLRCPGGIRRRGRARWRSLSMTRRARRHVQALARLEHRPAGGRAGGGRVGARRGEQRLWGARLESLTTAPSAARGVKRAAPSARFSTAWGARLSATADLTADSSASDRVRPHRGGEPSEAGRSRRPASTLACFARVALADRSGRGRGDRAVMRRAGLLDERS
jgi:hypothetical protein